MVCKVYSFLFFSAVISETLASACLETDGTLCGLLCLVSDVSGYYRVFFCFLPAGLNPAGC